MVAVLLLTLVFWASNADAHQLSQLEEVSHQIRPMTQPEPIRPLRPLVGYPVASMEDTFWHKPSMRRVVYEPDSQKEDRGFGARAPLEIHQLAVSAYTSRVEETDSTPFETASGKRVRWGIVASNKFPLGTRLRFPRLFGAQEFVVEDCMNARYRHRVDVWMPGLTRAREFGLKKEVEVEVVEYGQRRMCYS